jgi:predicted negative regulator of RcsB-dependent stress response
VDRFETEDQQAEAIKRWLKENGKSLVAGVALGLAVLIGTRQYLAHQDRVGGQASERFQALYAALVQGEKEALSEQSKRLREEFPGSPYAVLAALAEAKEALDGGDAQAARDDLRWALDHAEMTGMDHLARLRLARVHLDLGEPDQAMALVQDTDPGGFRALYEELKGDIYLARGDRESARSAYVVALAAQEGGARRELLQMKLDDLGGAEG